MVRIGVIGAGHIGGNLAGLLASSGHDVVASFSRDPARLERLAAETHTRAVSPAQAAEHGEVVLLAVPWPMVDTAIAQTGGPGALAGKIVIDTTNQFGRVDGHFGVLDLAGRSAAQTNAAKVPGATWVKAFNTLTAGFQAQAAGRDGPDRVVMFYAAASDAAVATVESLITAAGFTPVRTGTLARADVGHQEPKGDLYGEEFHYGEAVAAVARLRGTLPAGTGRP